MRQVLSVKRHERMNKMVIISKISIDNRIWSVVSTSGALVQGSYGHSSVWDPLTKRIYVYGGYQSESSSTYGLTNALYSYDTAQKVWRTHPSSGSYRYLHSAVMSGGLMLVYGGNTHNETAISNVSSSLNDADAFDVIFKYSGFVHFDCFGLHAITSSDLPAFVGRLK